MHFTADNCFYNNADKVHYTLLSCLAGLAKLITLLTSIEQLRPREKLEIIKCLLKNITTPFEQSGVRSFYFKPNFNNAPKIVIKFGLN